MHMSMHTYLYIYIHLYISLYLYPYSSWYRYIHLCACMCIYIYIIHIMHSYIYIFKKLASMSLLINSVPASFRHWLLLHNPVPWGCWPGIGTGIMTMFQRQCSSCEAATCLGGEKGACHMQGLLANRQTTTTTSQYACDWIWHEVSLLETLADSTVGTSTFNKHQHSTESATSKPLVPSVRC